MNNLKQIGLALHNYHEEHGCFPPAYVADAHGRPIHSWRVLILPWLEQKSVYDRYRFDEPWDGPNNRTLHDLVVSTYVCPSHPRQGHATSYAAVLGPETAWQGTEPVRLERVVDGPGQTIHLVEVSTPSIHWMEPRDLAFDRMSDGLDGPKGGTGPTSGHPGGANVLNVDGSVRFLLHWIGPERWQAMLTIAGGEAVREDE